VSILYNIFWHLTRGFCKIFRIFFTFFRQFTPKNQSPLRAFYHIFPYITKGVLQGKNKRIFAIKKEEKA
jgi:hypothetical protein